MKATIGHYQYEISPSTLCLLLLAWGLGHGLITLETNGHLQSIISDPARLYEHRVTDLLRCAGHG